MMNELLRRYAFAFLALRALIDLSLAVVIYRRAGSLVPAAELIKNNHSVGGLYLPSSVARCELFKPSLKKVLGWISSGDPKPTLGVR